MLNVSSVPSREALSFLRKYYDSFSVVPLQLYTRKSLEAIMEMHVPEYRSWGKPGTKTLPFTKFCDDLFRKHEGTVSLVLHRLVQYVVREIQTATARITVDVPAPTPLEPNRVLRKLLRQYRKTVDGFEERGVESSSSETLAKLEYPLHCHIGVIARAIQEELGITVAEEYLRHPYLYPVAPKDRPFTPLATDIPESHAELAIHACRKYPGTYTRNILHAFIWQMPLSYYNPEGYREPNTDNYFIWVDLGYYRVD